MHLDRNANLLTDTPNEVALAVAATLSSEAELLSLALSCKRYSAKCIVRHVARASSAQRADSQRWSIVEEAARQWLSQCSEQERNWVPRRGEESWIGLMREVRLLRQAPMFAQSHKDIVLSDCGSRATCGKQNDFDWCTAASEQVMRAGCHSHSYVT